jgi:hypothetical protein
MTLCFATLALGDQYNLHATCLAMDMARLCPETPLVVLTDRPIAYTRYGNVKVVRHRQRSVWRCYHDKRFAFEEGLALAERCVYLDADSRLLQRPPADDLCDPGQLRARGSSGLQQKYDLEIANEHAERARGRRRRTTASRRLRLNRDAAARAGVDVASVAFVPEPVLAVHRSGGGAARWLAEWEKLARYFELRGYSWGEGDAIGIAAAAVGWRVCNHDAVESWLFNDAFFRTEAQRKSPHLALIEQLTREHRAIADHFNHAKRRDPWRHARSAYQTIGQLRRYLALLIERP